MPNEGALYGLKVLDLGRVIAGPLCAAYLGDLGAQVIKVELPGKGDDARENLPPGGYFAAYNRSKRGITLDLKKGRNVFLQLVKEADVLIENFRPGVMERLGYGYEELKKINPGLIYAAATGFGQNGPYSHYACMDTVAQAMSGIMTCTGHPGDRPVNCGTSICDIMAAQFLTAGILLALQYRNRTGKGQMVDVALVDAGIVILSSVVEAYLCSGKIPGRMGNTVAAAAPGGSYPAIDGEAILNPVGQVAVEKLFTMMGREDLIQNPDYCNNKARVDHRYALEEIIEGWTKTKTVDELVGMFLKEKLVAGPVLNVEQVVNDEHLSKHRDMFTTVHLEGYGDVKITNQCLKMKGTPPKMTDPPALGQHNREVYAELGFTLDEIREMEANGVI
jgi:formyl-CoA transferase